MTRLVTTLVTVIFGLMLLAALGPEIDHLAGAVLPVVLVSGLVAGLLRILWWYTR
jgi:hypothetical protein